MSCRWRDVKLRAFENADHRTYVDLKVNFFPLTQGINFTWLTRKITYISRFNPCVHIC